MRTVTLISIPQNDHGCSGEVVEIRPTSRTEGLVIRATRCTSCGPLGHHSQAERAFRQEYEGKKVRLPEDVSSWWEAEKYYRIPSESLAGRTYVAPRDLEIIYGKFEPPEWWEAETDGIPWPLAWELKEYSRKTGIPQQTVIIKALEAYLKGANK
ncbi:MAG: hypothetical protein H0Z24_08740 [Thermosipho sp. (in: Bacteria)]|nr:hypothetical protein [Thermosipho sp. (in: thermotogales)]